jgi:hypothetical protein
MPLPLFSSVHQVRDSEEGGPLHHAVNSQRAESVSRSLAQLVPELDWPHLVCVREQRDPPPLPELLH